MTVWVEFWADLRNSETHGGPKQGGFGTGFSDIR